MRKNQSGSAIVMLFIAVALFGALAYAFMKGSRTSTGFLTDEQAKSYAQQIIEYSTHVKTAIKRIQLRGYKDTHIGFDNTVFKDSLGNNMNGPASNPNCTAAACQVFSVQGGGLTPQIFSTGLTTAGTGASRLTVIALQGAGTTEPDLVLQTLLLSQQVCEKINQLLGLNFGGSYIPPLDSFTNNSFVGTFPASPDPLGEVATGLSGKTTYCAQANGGGGVYHFNALMIAR